MLLLWELMLAWLPGIQDFLWGEVAGSDVGPRQLLPSPAGSVGQGPTWGFTPRNAISPPRNPSPHQAPQGLQGKVGFMPLHTSTDTPAGNMLSSSTSLLPRAKSFCGSEMMGQKRGH